jgi:cytochrome b561
MRFRNDADGYGLVTKVLHWTTTSCSVPTSPRI